jgi:2-iminobutanoate/2-iminopropanoate deaminase
LGGAIMHKQVIKADVPETGGPFNLCVRHGNMI